MILRHAGEPVRRPVPPAGLGGWAWGGLSLTDAPLHPQDILGGPGEGLRVFRRHFAHFRPLVAATALGTAAGAHTAASTPSGAAGLHGWTVLRANPPGDLDPAVRHRLHELAELEAAWPELAHGDRIVHGDLRADNMVRDHNLGVTFVDWAHATTGPACIDAVSLAPQLILAGHTPKDIARLLNEHPATATDPLASTAFLAALTGHWHRNARKLAPPGTPGLRDYQHRAATAGLALLGHRLS